ncbi:probable glycosyltransferase At3g07620 [Magnolia sinica]|uniref:probable glycosyltransferase At3g07620 n=1 Tax=Magnolia sinica TaxID=86752 RepID=UPI002658075C|nr:probable glycosyltransferase At3g07620 [Magnolia sinica]
MESFFVRCRNLCKNYSWRLVMVMGIMASVVLVLQSFILFHGSDSSSLFSTVKFPVLVMRSFGGEDSLPKSMRVGELSLLSDLVVLGAGKNFESSKIGGEIEGGNDVKEKERDSDDDFVLEKEREPDGDSLLKKDRDPDDGFALEKDINPDDDFVLKKDRDLDSEFSIEKDEDPDDDSAVNVDQDPDDGFLVENVVDPGHDFVLEVVTNQDEGFTLEKAGDPENESSVENVGKLGEDFALSNVGKSGSVFTLDTNRSVLQKPDANSSELAKPVPSNVSFMDKQGTKMLSKSENMGPLQRSSVSTNDNSTIAIIPIMKKKQGISLLNISEMNCLLLRRRVSSHPMKPRWSSVRDRELLSAKKQIENAPILKDDRELHAPAFRNISMFKRSFELMERILKVYIYKEGEKPIFHKPLLKGIYASEGWFMKLMEGNKHYVVKDPRKAHLFYLPFSSRLLQFALYVPRSHDHKNLVAYLKNYVDKIAVKYPFWNRTGGADHFLVACHDWAPDETRHNMERSVRALCNADLSKGFKLGRDVSLPETYVRSGQNPLRDLGGEPPSKRTTLAFYAGNMHGRLRTILLKYWENKDPNMKIIGPMLPGVESKMTYIRHMKTSKYCICPRGHGVNSPRVVEAIFYECVPVIISDNYVPPFFEVLDWEVFAVFVVEKDIPMLKDILASIPEKRYLTMQTAVKKVQQHFLWHSKPVKYDIFHMILHSIWLNRLHQIRI